MGNSTNSKNGNETMNAGNNPISISVVIPTFNRPRELRRALDSVIAQNYSPLEIIVIDDNARNVIARQATAQVITDYAQPILYIQTEEPCGGSKARNIGIKAATSDWIAFLDDDDEWLLEKLHAQATQISHADENVACFDTGFLEVNEKTGISRTIRPQLKGKIFTKLLVKHRGRAPKLSTCICHRSTLLEIGCFDSSLPARQDLDLYLRIAREHEFLYLEQPYAIKYIHEGGQITDSPTKKVLGFLRMYEKYLTDLKKHPILHILYRLQIARWLLKDGQWGRAILCLLSRSIM